MIQFYVRFSVVGAVEARALSALTMQNINMGYMDRFLVDLNYCSFPYHATHLNTFG
jgi:hypothetical protein